MANKNFNTRIQLKSDTEANWDKATNFIPLEGEAIIYSADSTHPFSRLKVGDGVTVVSELPFVEGESQNSAITGVKGNSESDYRTGNVNITPANIGLGNVDNTSDLNKPISTATQEALDEKVNVVEGKGLSTEDYTSAEKTKLANIEANAQVNTITGVKGDSESEYRTGDINITKANIGLSNVNNTSDADKPISTATQTALNNKISTSLKGAASGVAELDENGKVPTSQLPSFVDDVVEYSSSSNFPLEGESGKIYVDTLNNKTYRWSGSAYVEISPSLALGETSATAYRGDRGKAAYDHAQAKGSAFTSGLYKITTNAEGHVTAVTPVTKADITALGIPGQDTTYQNVTTSAAGLMSAADKAKLDGIAAGAQVNSVTGVKGGAESSYRTGNVNLTPANIGLGNVDNTSDMNKPVSTAQQAALDDKADASDVATIEQKLDSASAYGEVGPVPVADISNDLPLDAAKFVIDIEPVQSGSGDPSPTNVRPISGWTGANVTRTGKNLLNLVESEMILDGWNRAFPISLKEGTYILSCQNDFGSSSVPGAKVSLADESNSIIKDLTNRYDFGQTGFRVGVATTLSAEDAGKIKRILFQPRLGNTHYSDIARGDLQLELGSTATDYAPYQGDIYNNTFPSEAGTVYGGTLDVVNGALTVDRGNIASYAGETLPGAWISSMDVYTVGGTPTTGAQVVYDLATPITYQLTPQQVALLKGDNTVFADCGDTTVGYWRDDSLSINKAITERAQVGSGCPYGTFTTADGKTVTVTNGFITAITP